MDAEVILTKHSGPPRQPSENEVPLAPLSMRQRAKQLSQLSLQSQGSDALDAAYGDMDSGGLSPDENKDTLHLACWSGDKTAVIRMINDDDCDLDLNNLDMFGRTALHNAVLGHHVEIVEWLLAAGADISIVDRSKDAPLHTAVRTGNENLVKAFLLHKKCDANITGKGSQTALHMAAKRDKVSICKMLVAHGASPDCRDDEKMTPLTRAMEQGACNAAEFLFVFAKTRHKKDMMKDVLSNVDSVGSTLLHLAVDSESPAAVELCLNNGAVILQPKESDRSTAFHSACAVGSLEIVKLFVSKDPEICKITPIDAQGWTPLHLAALNNHPDVVQYLLQKGASVDIRDKLRRTPLFLAAERGGTDSVKVLINNGADVTVKDLYLRSCVRIAEGHTATIEVLLQKREALPLITDKDISGFSPVHYAARYGHLQDILLFIKRNKAATSVTSDTQDTALHVAARYGWLEIVDALLYGGNNRFINIKNNQGKTALHFACAEGHDRVVEHLLKLGATVQSDHNDRTALHVAAMRGSKRCVECMLQHQPQCINIFDKNQNTALHLAAMHGYPDVVSCLLSCKDQEILMNKKNQNALDVAMEANMKSSLMAIAGHKRWREVMTSSAPGHMVQMKALVKKFPEVAVRFMDQCMIKEGNPSSEDYSITYDFSLIQGAITPGQDHLMVLKTMLKHRRLSCLAHPVSFIFMSTKWERVGHKILPFSLLFQLVVLILLTLSALEARANEKQLCGFNETLTRKEYIEFKSIECSSSNAMVTVLQLGVVTTMALNLLFELLLLITRAQKCKYLFRMSTLLKWTGNGFALHYVLPLFCDCKPGYKQEIGAIALFLGWMSFMLLIRGLSSHGKYFIMMSTMFITLLKVLPLFFLFIMAFSTSLYLLMDDETEQYATFPNSMMTTFVMTLGELNYADLFMPWSKLGFSALSNILFVLLVLVMPIILINMLVGLAVGDVHKIQTNAAMDRYVMQVELVLDGVQTYHDKRPPIRKYVEYPNKDTYEKVCNRIFGVLGMSIVPPVDYKEEDETSTDLHPVCQPLLKRMEDHETNIRRVELRINGIYDLLKEQSTLLKTVDRARRQSCF